jgi:hypothetical protein
VEEEEEEEEEDEEEEEKEKEEEEKFEILSSRLLPDARRAYHS